MFKLFLTILILMLFTLIVLLFEAKAHDRNRPDLDNWFDKLASGKGLCCSYIDGAVVADADWKSKDGHYQVKLYDHWFEVPEDALITVPNRDGRTMVWPLTINGETMIRCFMPGAMT